MAVVLYVELEKINANCKQEISLEEQVEAFAAHLHAIILQLPIIHLDLDPERRDGEVARIRFLLEALTGGNSCPVLWYYDLAITSSLEYVKFIGCLSCD